MDDLHSVYLPSVALVIIIGVMFLFNGFVSKAPDRWLSESDDAAWMQKLRDAVVVNPNLPVLNSSGKKYSIAEIRTKSNEFIFRQLSSQKLEKVSARQVKISRSNNSMMFVIP